MVYSHSRINCFKMCPKKYEYKYIQKLEPINESKNLLLGKLVHKGIELRNSVEFLNYIDEQNIPISDNGETNVVLALSMVDAFFKKFGNDEIKKNEVYFETEYDGAKIRGYIDGLIETEKGYWLEEIKTASTINKEYVDKLEFNDQINLYLYAGLKNNLHKNSLDKPIIGVKYRVIKKPLLRQKKNETVVEFRVRLTEKLIEDDNIYEFELYRTSEEIENAMKDFSQDVKTLENTNRFTRTLSACTTYGRCEYMDLCASVENAEALYKISDRKEEEDGE